VNHTKNIREIKAIPSLFLSYAYPKPHKPVGYDIWRKEHQRLGPSI